MMCKLRRWVLAAILLALALLLVVPAHAQEAETDFGNADFLLLHEEQISEEQLGSLRLLADGATALGKSMDLATPAQAKSVLGHYSLILCYDLKPNATLARSLAESGAKVLLLGGEILPDCLQAAGIPEQAQKISQVPENAVLRYTISEQEYESIVTLPETVYEISQADYSSGSLQVNLHTLPFCWQMGTLCYIPLTDFTPDLSRAALLQEISTWLWEYSGLPPQKGQYVVLDEIYAYMPAQSLLDRVELLAESGTPFVLSVMPVYQNTDYPAMQQFCEVLRHAQANGGAVILHTPILRVEVSDCEEFSAKMTEVLNAFTAQGVYPLGFDVPYSWAWNADALAWMQRSRTVFIHEDSKTPDFTRDTRQNLLYYNYHALVLPALSLGENSAASYSVFSAAHRIAASASLEELQAQLSQLQSAQMPYYSLWSARQSVWADNFHLAWQDGALTINDTVCSLDYTPQSAPESYDYRRNALQRFTMNIQNESHFLIVLVTVVTVLFLLMIFYARRRQRLHFLYRPKSDVPEESEPGPKGGGQGCP